MYESKTFNNRFTSQLTADPDQSEGVRQVSDAAYSWVKPTPVKTPKLIAFSPEMAHELTFSEKDIQSDEWLAILAGNAAGPGMQPFAMNYGGHQFGQWAGQLGDGRAINLGEWVGRKEQLWMLQLKGAGPTPYSRRADGRAVLRSSIREFLCSEAMFHLGVPTTRALSLILTGDSVLRDMFYDGRAELEPGAIVCRVAPSFVRFGSFQIHAARGEVERLRELADFTIKEHYSHLGKPSKQVYERWFEEVAERTINLVVHWMRVGFVHGVLNTDNMSILGQTIDYGPYGWIDNYDPDWTPNTTDAQSRRYVFGNQAAVAHWNLAQLARCIHVLTNDPEPLQRSLDAFPERYEASFNRMMANKLGLYSWLGEPDKHLVSRLLQVLHEGELDYSIFFRELASFSEGDNVQEAVDISSAWYSQPSDALRSKLGVWFDDYSNRLKVDSSEEWNRVETMNTNNPKYVLRNYLSQLAIDKAHDGDYSMVTELLDVMRHPYDEQPRYEKYAAKRPEWARNKPGSSMLSCSS